MFWGDRFAPTRPKNAGFDEQQKPTYNHRVTRGASNNTGKYAVFLPSLLEAKMRVPQLLMETRPAQEKPDNRNGGFDTDQLMRLLRTNVIKARIDGCIERPDILSAVRS
jgi:hypothetical protein